MARRKSNLNTQNFKGTLQNDNLYVNPRLLNLSELTGYETMGRIDKMLVVTDPATGKDKAINTFSKDYGLLPNEKFIPMVEERLENAGINYIRRVISRNEGTRYAIDYILEDDNYHTNVKNNRDIIKPMFRLVNSYDGSSQTEGHFGFFREVCTNGLHVARTQLHFKLRHRGDIIELTMPKIEELIAAFMDNEFYSIQKKFQVLAESPITDLHGFVKYTLGKSGLFKYQKSEKNPEDPSVGAQIIIDTIQREAETVKTAPNLWLGYNAFNEYIHTQNERLFTLQEKADQAIFNIVLDQVN